VPDKLATTRKSKNSQVFDSVLAKIITVAQLFLYLATTFQLKPYTPALHISPWVGARTDNGTTEHTEYTEGGYKAIRFFFHVFGGSSKSRVEQMVCISREPRRVLQDPSLIRFFEVLGGELDCDE
jgi:hypothetical protein